MKNISEVEINKKTIITSISISTLVSWAALKKLLLNPDQQRYVVWEADYAIDLIDTLKIGIPIPTVTIVKKNKKYHVIDGRQRLTTIFIMFFGKEFDKIVGSDEYDEYSKETIKEILQELIKNKLIFNSMSEIEQGKVLNFRVPMNIIDLDNIKTNDALKDEIMAILFDRLNRNNANMSDQNIYLSGLAQTLPDEIKQIKKIKDQNLINIAKKLGIKSKSKTIDLGILKDIRAMKLLSEKHDLEDNGHVSVRYNKALREIENKYINEKNQDKKIKLAKEEFYKLKESIKKIEKELNQNTEKIGVPKNETQRKTIMWFILSNRINEIYLNNEKSVVEIMKETQDSEEYEKKQEKAGLTAPQRLYIFINMFLIRVKKYEDGK